MAERDKRQGAAMDYAARWWDITNYLGLGRRLRVKTIALAGIGEGDRVLDVGCGTGTLALLEKHTVGPRGYVAGIDLAPKMIARALAKARHAGAEVDFRMASIASLPFPDRSFTVVSSSLMVHHLPTEIKRQGFAEVWRVLRPAGRFLIFDISPAGNFLDAWLRFFFSLPFPSRTEAEYTRNNMAGRIPILLQEAGFEDVRYLEWQRTLGRALPLAFLVARKPD